MSSKCEHVKLLSKEKPVKMIEDYKHPGEERLIWYWRKQELISNPLFTAKGQQQSPTNRDD